jgi:galactose mutarotase-like enzyme
MIVTIQNEQLSVSIEDAGAQLASVRGKDGTEYLWQGDPDIWPRRAPLLFPVIGRLMDGSYVLDGETFQIPTHGFCRSAPFTAANRGVNHVSFRYQDSEETRAVYPFSFGLTVTYTLAGNRLTKTHQVENHSQRTMYYELGGHDGYRAPLAPGESMDDYAIRIPGLSTLMPYGMDEACMITPKKQLFPLDDGRIPLTPSVFDLDTIVLDKLPQHKAFLVDAQNRPRVTVEFDQFAYLGIWTANKPFPTGYVCIEPWTTLPDAVFAGRGLSDKPGIRALLPGQSETLSFTTTFD